MYPGVHENITAKSLEEHLTTNVLRYLCESNKDSDNLVHMKCSAQHFTDSKFREGLELVNRCQDIFVNEMRMASESLKKKQEKAAENNFLHGVYALGRMFHAIQDFYSHTNWINLTGRELKAWNESVEAPNIESSLLLKTCQSGVIRDIHKFFRKRSLAKDKKYYLRFCDPSIKKLSHYELCKDGKKSLADLAYQYKYGVSGFDMACKDAREHTSKKWQSIIDSLNLDKNPDLAKAFNYLKSWDVQPSKIRKMVKKSRAYVDNLLEL